MEVLGRQNEIEEKGKRKMRGSEGMSSLLKTNGDSGRRTNTRNDLGRERIY